MDSMEWSLDLVHASSAVAVKGYGDEIRYACFDAL